MAEKSMGGIWREVLEDLRDNISEPAFETALKNADVRVEDGRVILRFPDPFMLRMINTEGSERIRKAFTRHFGEGVQLKLLAEPDPEAEHPGIPEINTGAILDRINRARHTLGQDSATDKPAESGRVRRSDSIHLNPRYTFDNFVVGSHNQLAHAAAEAIAREPGTVYNPLFVYAFTGLGKTHLLQAVGHEVLNNRPEARVNYVTSEAFTNELIAGIKDRDRMSNFNRKYRNADVLLIDDIQFLIGKTQTQETFFHLFNTLHELGRQIVISSDRPPVELETLEERLISRFEWGLTVDISKPDYETRLAILHKKNEERKFNLPSDILARIAGRVDSNVRELEGALTKVSAHHRLNRVQLTLEDVDDVLMHMRRTVSKGCTPMPQDIIEEVATHFKVSVDDLLGDRRTARISIPRQLGMYFCRELTHLSLKDIGHAFGGKDHTTVIYAINRVEERLGVDEAFAQDVLLLKARLKDRLRPSSG